MKKVFLIWILVIVILFSGCNNRNNTNDRHNAEKNSLPDTTEADTSKDVIIDCPGRSYELIFWFDSKDVFKSFLMGDDRERIMEDSYIDLSEENAQKLCKVADHLSKESVYTVSFETQPGSVCIWVPDDSVIGVDYFYKYDFEKYDIDFNIMKPHTKEWLEEKGIVDFVQSWYDNYTVVEDGFVADDGDSYTFTKITIEDKEIDAVYRTGGYVALYFELDGQYCNMFFRYKPSLDEVLEIVKGLEIHKLNLYE